MKVRAIAASGALVLSMGVGLISGSSALAAGKKTYACSINPKAAACQTTPSSSTVNGVVAGVAQTGGSGTGGARAGGAGGAAPGALPQTGGGAGAGGDLGLLGLLGAAMLATGGWALRRTSRL